MLEIPSLTPLRINSIENQLHHPIIPSSHHPIIRSSDQLHHQMSSRRGNSRGFGRRGGGGGSWRGTSRSRGRAENRQPRSPSPPLPFGPTIDSFNSKTLLIEELAPTIQDVEYLASYNWLDGKAPIILVPGQCLIVVCCSLPSSPHSPSM
jgi:hypothetical protein